VHRPAANHEARADTGADGDVAHAVASHRGAARGLSEGSRVHIGIDDPVALEPVRQRSGDICMTPTRLGRAEHVTVINAGWVNPDGSEAGDAKASEHAFILPRPQLPIEGAQSSIRALRGHFVLRHDRTVLRQHGNGFGAAEFDSGEAHGPRHFSRQGRHGRRTP